MPKPVREENKPQFNPYLGAPVKSATKIVLTPCRRMGLSRIIKKADSIAKPLSSTLTSSTKGPLKQISNDSVTQKSVLKDEPTPAKKEIVNSVEEPRQNQETIVAIKCEREKLTKQEDKDVYKRESDSKIQEEENENIETSEEESLTSGSRKGQQKEMEEAVMVQKGRKRVATQVLSFDEEPFDGFTKDEQTNGKKKIVNSAKKEQNSEAISKSAVKNIAESKAQKEEDEDIETSEKSLKSKPKKSRPKKLEKVQKGRKRVAAQILSSDEEAFEEEKNWEEPLKSKRGRQLKLKKFDDFQTLDKKKLKEPEKVQKTKKGTLQILSDEEDDFTNTPEEVKPIKAKKNFIESSSESGRSTPLPTSQDRAEDGPPLLSPQNKSVKKFKRTLSLKKCSNDLDESPPHLLPSIDKLQTCSVLLSPIPFLNADENKLPQEVEQKREQETETKTFEEDENCETNMQSLLNNFEVPPELMTVSPSEDLI